MGDAQSRRTNADAQMTHNIISVMFLPKMHNLNLVKGNIRKTQDGLQAT